MPARLTVLSGQAKVLDQIHFSLIFFPFLFFLLLINVKGFIMDNLEFPLISFNSCYEWFSFLPSNGL